MNVQHSYRSAAVGNDSIRMHYMTVAIASKMHKATEIAGRFVEDWIDGVDLS